MPVYPVHILRHDHAVVEVRADSEEEAWAAADAMVKYATDAAARGGEAVLPPGTQYRSKWETTLIEPVQMDAVTP